jgi:hypothetical protein
MCFVNIIVAVFIYSFYAEILSRMFIYLFMFVFSWCFLNIVSWMLHIGGLE